eukprot:Lithocolla_globosa_v1_NODE_1097_length_2874_cov_6.510110.p4 type:complete len:102 gc:universal NODE_1097_length_2874_cov_6.510110:1047-742(-)
MINYGGEPKVYKCQTKGIGESHELDQEYPQCKFASSNISLEKSSETSKLGNSMILTVEELCQSLFEGCDSLCDAGFSWDRITAEFFQLRLTSKLLHFYKDF